MGTVAVVLLASYKNLFTYEANRSSTVDLE